MNLVKRFLLGVCAVVLLSLAGWAQAGPILVSNTSTAAGTASLEPFTEYEWAFGYSSTPTPVRFTAMRLAFSDTLSGTPYAVFRDGDGNTTGPRPGTSVGTLTAASGTFGLYEFSFGTAFLGVASEYYAAYAFNNGPSYSGFDTPLNPISIASTTIDTIAFSTQYFSSATYNYFQPGNLGTVYPYFELIAVPEPGTMTLAAMATAGGMAAIAAALRHCRRAGSSAFRRGRKRRTCR